MGTLIKVLGQVLPEANTDTVGYTVPLATSSVISSIIICDLDNTSNYFSIRIRKAGATENNKEYIYYNQGIGSNTFIATVGITLAAGDSIIVYGLYDNISFNIFGQENT